jgi:L,D-transpeptidase catalytic domain/Putative peptidoglycan binding domain
MGRTTVVIGLVGALALAVPGSVGAADTRIIASGTSAGGVDLSGLTVDEAAGRLDGELSPKIAAPVVVAVAGRSFSLAAARAGVKFDPRKTAERAYYQGRTGAGDVPLAIEHSDEAVRGFVRDVDHRVGRPARNARVRITLKRIVRVRGRSGIGINAGRLAKRVAFALDHPAASRTLTAKRKRTRPQVSGRDLRRRYGTVLTVDRDHFKLRLFKHLRHSRTYGIAVGMAGLSTPAGVFSITEKQVNPAWHVPNAAWAGALAGQTIPGGAPNNPLKARWLGITDGVGIHGTAEDWSIGSRASHGCIRMHVHDVIALYPRVPIGTPVLIR